MKAIKHNKQAVSLGDIAAEAGVTVATVSRVLNSGRPDLFAPATRRRIEEVARRLKYRPNLAASGVRSGKTQMIGLILPLDGLFYPAMVGGIHDGLAERNYAAMVAWNKEDRPAADSEQELGIIHRIVDRRVDGIILRPTHDDVSDMYFREVWERGIPLVTVDRELPGVHCDFSGTEDEEGGRLAALHLLLLGHRRLGLLAGPELVSTARDRRRGFEQAVATFGDGAICVTMDCSHFHKVYRETINLLQMTPPVTCLFCPSDDAAVEVYKAAAELRLRIPQDLSVVGFADMAIASYLSPTLTTLRQNPSEIGRQAARLLLERIEGSVRDEGPRKVRLSPELVVRGSTTAFGQ